MSPLIGKTTKSDQEIAITSVEFLEKSEKKVIENKKKTVKMRLQESEDVLEIPFNAFLLLKSILSNMAEGKSMTLIPSDSEISTQQAAEILNVSRPHVVKLLEKGEIPHTKVGSHRRVKLNDLLSYKSKFEKSRRKNLDILAKEAQDLNLGYE